MRKVMMWSVGIGGSTQSSFHNAAGVAKNNAGTAALTHVFIIGRILEASKINDIIF